MKPKDAAHFALIMADRFFIQELAVGLNSSQALPALKMMILFLFYQEKVVHFARWWWPQIKECPFPKSYGSKSCEIFTCFWITKVMLHVLKLISFFFFFFGDGWIAGWQNLVVHLHISWSSYFLNTGSSGDYIASGEARVPFTKECFLNFTIIGISSKWSCLAINWHENIIMIVSPMIN